MRAFNIIEIIDNIKSRRIGQNLVQDILNDVKEFVINNYSSPSDDIDYQVIMAFIESKLSGKLGGSATYTNKALTFLKNELKDFRKNEKNEKQEYDRFMKDYKENHKYCPVCFRESYNITLVDYIFNLQQKDSYKNLNLCECINCGDKHTFHERVSKDVVPEKIINPKKEIPNDKKYNKECIINWDLHHEIRERFNKRILKETPEDVVSKKDHYNIVIAEFLGAKSRIIDNGLYSKKPFTVYDFPNGHCLQPEIMYYDSDWTELMKAIHKIESLSHKYHGDFSVIIGKNKCIILGSNADINENTYNEYVSHDNKITSTWLSVVWFIIWYNINIKEGKK